MEQALQPVLDAVRQKQNDPLTCRCGAAGLPYGPVPRSPSATKRPLPKALSYDFEKFRPTSLLFSQYGFA
jgi:hypothetical protein